MARGATFVDTIRGIVGLSVREALPDKGFGGCATKADKSKKCRTPYLKMGPSVGKDGRFRY